MPNLEVVDLPLADLHPFHKNPRKGNVQVIADSLRVNGQYKPIVVNRGTLTGRPNEILAGNHTYAAAHRLGWGTMDAVLIDVDEEQAQRIVVADNRSSDLGTYDNELLAELLDGLADLDGTGYTAADLEALTQEPGARAAVRLADRFGAPPLSVLSARGGAWSERKKSWIALGIQSEIGREGALVYNSPQTLFGGQWYEVKNAAELAAGHRLTDAEVMRRPEAAALRSVAGGTSVFDPALTELVYAWFSAPGMRVLDPWAGGSVRGIVAAVLGRDYTGIELRPEQIEANRAQLESIGAAVAAGYGMGGGEPEWLTGSAEDALAGLADESYDMAFSAPPKYPVRIEMKGTPEWVEGESTEVLRDVDAASYDLAFGCPPYYDLEKYSDDPRDLSNLTVAEFDAQMVRNIAEVARVLRPDSYAVFVVGSVRDRNGYVLDMRRCMSTAAEAAGLRLVNDAVLLTPVGNAAPRAARGFKGTRTLARVHQEVLVYVKGDRKRASARCGEVEALAVAEVEKDEDNG